MRSTIILAIFALVFASCTNDVPTLPTPEQVEGYQFCLYKEKMCYKCKSTYEISDIDCPHIGGVIYTDIASCIEDAKSKGICEN